MDCMKTAFRCGEILDGRFRSIAPLNHGSFGMVFLAEDLTTGLEVAIKCLTKPSAGTSDLPITTDEGADELACHAVLKYHPHLVNLVHHFETAAHTYLVLEYCSNGDLYEAIRESKGPLQTQHVRRFMLQLISAVEHMHNNGLYHRDIKPENIFLTANGDMKLGDFGLATRSLWSQEACVGSDRYMAPEQYDHGGNGYSPATADLWSIGICLLNVLFARNPFVTPTESDVLFADYVRDRQSLFDIFPSMSQDTYEILAIAMALDPTKRDLHSLRFAIQRAITFTTDDEDLDDFCTEQRDVIPAAANREPLRTPSVQSPQMDGDSFPWAQVLHSSPQKRSSPLPAIPDDYDEDLFATSQNGVNLAESWFSGRYNTPSSTSAFDSAFGLSFKSVNVQPRASRPAPVSIPSSLPVQRSRPIVSMSQIFGKRDTVAKSWSDMLEEDEEETALEEALRARRELNARSFSHDSENKMPPSPTISIEEKSASGTDDSPVSRHHHRKHTAPAKPSQLFDETENLSWQPKTPKRSPPQVPMDKWAELGDRRRNVPKVDSTRSETKKRSMTQSSRKTRSSSTVEQSWFRRQSRNKSRPAYLNQDWRQQKVLDSSEEDDHEWVGGWHNFHL